MIYEPEKNGHFVMPDVIRHPESTEKACQFRLFDMAINDLYNQYSN